jgi:hypothetical protein
MENKYYTPTIEEFHVGFEYEVLAGTDWVNTQIHVENITLNIDRVINHIETCRVKYLDKEDIESLGFEHKGSLWFDFKKYFWKIRKWNKNEIDLYYCFATMDMTGEDDKELRFRGAIKNKSELIKLMNQLNIR